MAPDEPRRFWHIYFTKKSFAHAAGVTNTYSLDKTFESLDFSLVFKIWCVL